MELVGVGFHAGRTSGASNPGSEVNSGDAVPADQIKFPEQCS